MSNLLVSPASLADCHQITQIHKASIPQAWNKQQFEAWLEDPNYQIFIAQQEKILGYLILRTIDNEAEIITLAVHPNARRQGIGRLLLEHLYTLEIQTFHLEVAEDNIPAQSLYHSHGFKETGHRPNYYNHLDGTKDAILMTWERM